jgi:hypothetical protein
MGRRLKVAEAAAILGVAPSFVRIAIQQGMFTFGTFMKLSSERTYFINPHQFCEYVGISMEQLEDMLADQSIMNKA